MEVEPLRGKRAYKRAMAGALLLLSVFVWFGGCKGRETGRDRTSLETLADDQSTYAIDGVIRGTADLYLGTLNPGTERPQRAFFQYKGYNYRLICTLPYSQNGMFQLAVYQDYLYYFGEFDRRIYALDIGHPDRQIDITPPDLVGSNDKYVFIDLITIEDDWIYLGANKYGIREDGGECYLPGYYLAVNINGEDWKEITEEDVPKEKSSG